MEMSSPELQKSCSHGGGIFPVISQGWMVACREVAADCSLLTPKAISSLSESPVQHPNPQEHSCGTACSLSSASTSHLHSSSHPRVVQSRSNPPTPGLDASTLPASKAVHPDRVPQLRFESSSSSLLRWLRCSSCRQ